MREKNLLIVDDVEMNRKFLGVSFRDNYNIFEAKNGLKALEIIENNTIDIVITDIFMDVMNGYELIDHIRNDENLKDMPIIAITENDNASKVKAMRAGANFFITRPFVGKDLAATIKKSLDNVYIDEADIEDKEQRDLMVSILDNVPAGILVFRIKDGNISLVEANPAICEMMGIERDKALLADQHDIVMLTYPEDVPIVLDAARKLSAPGTRVNYEYRSFYRSKRDYVWVSGNGYSVAQPDGSVWAYVSFTDITEKRKLLDAQTDLIAEKKANKSKSSFLSNMSHDIRTPLNAILNLTTLAKGEINDSNQLLVDLEKISVAGEFLLSLINDILDMSKIESGHIDLKPTVYSTLDFDEYIYSVIEPLCSKKDLHFNFKGFNRACYMYIDRTRFNQIVFNLLSNATKYTDNGGDVSLEILPIDKGSYVVTDIIVKDNGKGMSKKFQKRLFKPFEREDNREAYTGTGLGLAITKTIVDKMNGTISVESEQGAGTTVRINMNIPMADDKQVEEYKTDLSKKDDMSDSNISDLCKGKRVLIVEDHPLNQEIVCRLLQKFEIITMCSDDGKNAIDVFNEKGENYFDAILMDIRMPVQDGLETTRIIRRMGSLYAKNIPIIAMTANAFADDVLESEQAGMNDHLSKPIDPVRLFSSLSKWFAIREAGYKQKIVIVDDVEINATVIAETLKDEYDLICVDDGLKALDTLANTSDIVAVITDIQMPYMNGIELCKAIRSDSRYDNIAILANTQYGDSGQEDVLLSIGADDFVYKPTTPNILTTRLKNVLARHKRVIS